MAGMDGIKNKIHPGDASDQDLYELSDSEVAKLPTVCGSLREALEAVDEDRAFLTEGGVFTDDQIDGYIDLIMQEVYELEHSSVMQSPEYAALKSNPTEWSKRMSPDVIGTKYIRNVYEMIFPTELTEEIALSPMAPA